MRLFPFFSKNRKPIRLKFYMSLFMKMRCWICLMVSFAHIIKFNVFWSFLFKNHYYLTFLLAKILPAKYTFLAKEFFFAYWQNCCVKSSYRGPLYTCCLRLLLAKSNLDSFWFILNLQKYLQGVSKKWFFQIILEIKFRDFPT